MHLGGRDGDELTGGELGVTALDLPAGRRDVVLDQVEELLRLGLADGLALLAEDREHRRLTGGAGTELQVRRTEVGQLDGQVADLVDARDRGARRLGEADDVDQVVLERVGELERREHRLERVGEVELADVEVDDLLGLLLEGGLRHEHVDVLRVADVLHDLVERHVLELPRHGLGRELVLEGAHDLRVLEGLVDRVAAIAELGDAIPVLALREADHVVPRDLRVAHALLPGLDLLATALVVGATPLGAARTARHVDELLGLAEAGDHVEHVQADVLGVIEVLALERLEGLDHHGADGLGATTALLLVLLAQLLPGRTPLVRLAAARGGLDLAVHLVEEVGDVLTRGTEVGLVRVGT